VVGVDEHAQHELTADDHLLDVEDVHAVPGQHGEQHRRHTRLVRS
jgi:hypothetical protein